MSSLRSTRPRCPRLARPQAQVRRPPLTAIVSDPKDAAGIARAYLEHCYTQQEIADHLDVHYATISRRLDAVAGRRYRDTTRDRGA
jgi:hypothetical protein